MDPLVKFDEATIREFFSKSAAQINEKEATEKMKQLAFLQPPTYLSLTTRLSFSIQTWKLKQLVVEPNMPKSKAVAIDPTFLATDESDFLVLDINWEKREILVQQKDNWLIRQYEISEGIIKK